MNGSVETKLWSGIDKMNSKMTKCKAVQRNRIKKAKSKANNRITNLIKEEYFKIAIFLAKNYQHIILPEYKIQNMVKKLRVLTGSPYFFRQRLDWICKKYNSKLHIVTEEYTSQTCTKCGVRQKIGGKETYSCQNCNMVLCRDINGARNILIKTISACVPDRAN